jgi:hypothetical protein
MKNYKQFKFDAVNVLYKRLESNGITRHLKWELFYSLEMSYKSSRSIRNSLGTSLYDLS